MSVLLRHPASVPARFSRAMDAETPAAPRAAHRLRFATSAQLVAVSGWATVMLIDAPLVKAAAMVVALAMPG